MINDVLSHFSLGVLSIGRLRSTVLQVVYSLKVRKSVRKDCSLHCRTLPASNIPWLFPSARSYQEGVYALRHCGGMPPPENRFSMTGTSSLAGRAAVLARCFRTGLLSLRTVLGKWPARLSIGIDGQTTSALGWYKHRVCCGSGAH